LQTRSSFRCAELKKSLEESNNCGCRRYFRKGDIADVAVIGLYRFCLECGIIERGCGSGPEPDSRKKDDC